MRRRFVIAASLWFCCLLLSSCDGVSRLEGKDPEDVSRTKTYFEMLRAGKYDEVEKTLDPSLKDEDFRVTYDALVGTNPEENTMSSKPTVAERRSTAA